MNNDAMGIIIPTKLLEILTEKQSKNLPGFVDSFYFKQTTDYYEQIMKTALEAFQKERDRCIDRKTTEPEDLQRVFDKVTEVYIKSIKFLDPNYKEGE